MSIRLTMILSAVLGISLATISVTAQAPRVFVPYFAQEQTVTGQDVTLETNIPRPPNPPEQRTIRCPKCNATYPAGHRHVCYVDILEGIGTILENPRNNWTQCQNCGQRYRRGTQHVCPQQNPRPPQLVTCRMCGQQYFQGTRHVCPQVQNPRPQLVTCSRCGVQYLRGTAHQCRMVKCSRCGVQYPQGTAHQCRMVKCSRCGVQYPQGTAHQCPVVTCSRCGQQYVRGTAHMCKVNSGNPVPPKTPPQSKPTTPTTTQAKPTVTNTTPQKPSQTKPQTPQLMANPSYGFQPIKPSTRILENAQSVVDTEKDVVVGDLKKESPSEEDIKKRTEDMNLLNPAEREEAQKLADTINEAVARGDTATAEEATKKLQELDAENKRRQEELKKAVLDGDTKKVEEHLKNSDGTPDQNDALRGLTLTNDIINKYENGKKIPPGDINNAKDLMKNDPSLGNLSSGLQQLGTLNKIGQILDIAGALLGGGGILGGGTTIPQVVVPIITFPHLPYGMMFPLGNGVWGMGTGGMGETGIYQGYLPQPPVYEADSLGEAEDSIDFVVHNKTGQTIKYRVKDSEVVTLDDGSWQSWTIGAAQIPVQLPGRNGSWVASKVNPGAYEFAKTQNGGWTLKAVPTEVTLSSPGSPVPFTFYIGEDSQVIEPGQSITLSDPKRKNSVYEIRFARSADVEDVATYAVGGKMNLVVGIDQSEGKWAMFPGEAEPVKPASPQQSATAANSTLTYDITPISRANVGELPVLPDFD